MQRREFIQTLGAAAPAAIGTRAAELAAVGPAGAMVRPSEEPRVFLYDDGRHAAPLYQFAPPLKPADLMFTVDQLVGSGVDTLVYFAGLEGGVALYDSRVAQRWGDNVTRWTHPVFYRAARHIHKLIAEGHDPLKLLCDRCHEKGLWFIASNYLTLLGGKRTADGGMGRKSDFVYEHPQFQVGPDDDPRAKGVTSYRFSFLHEAFRMERFKVFHELLLRYETDGIELNLAEFAPYCTFRQIGQLAPVLTEWLRALRDTARKAEESQGRRKRIYVRIPAHPDAWKLLGYDVPTWVREKLVDGLMCLPGLMESPMDQGVDLSGAVHLTEQAACRVIAAFSDLLGRQLERAATQPMIWAAAANAYHGGANGFAIVDYHWTPNGWPWTNDDYKTLRLLGHPDLLATADKIYRARSALRRPELWDDWLPGVPLALPQPLEESKPVAVGLKIADDLKLRGAEGTVQSVHLRVRLTNLEPSLNDVRIELNGQLLPDSIRRLGDLTYRLYRLGAINPYGFVYDFQLPGELYPKIGDNNVKVTLLKHDPNIDTRIELYDVDCAVNYRMHRHFQQPPIDY